MDREDQMVASKEGGINMQLETMTRKEKEYIFRRQEIMEAAERLFGQKGFFKTTMLEIAQQSQFAIGTLYQFFKSKEEVYCSLLEEKAHQFFNFVKDRVESAQGLDKIRALTLARLEYAQKNINFFKIFLVERAYFEWDIKADFGERVYYLYLSFIDYVTDMIGELVEKGLLKAVKPRDLAISLIGITNSMLFQMFLESSEWDLEDRASLITELFLEGARK